MKGPLREERLPCPQARRLPQGVSTISVFLRSRDLFYPRLKEEAGDSVVKNRPANAGDIRAVV